MRGRRLRRLLLRAPRLGPTAGRTCPRALGHEVSGVVERVGAEVRELRARRPGRRLDAASGFAEYVAVEAEHCFPAGDVPLDLALGEPLACAVNAVELADVKLGDDVVIIGAGFMGNLVQQLVAAARSAPPDRRRHPRRRAGAAPPRSARPAPSTSRRNRCATSSRS